MLTAKRVIIATLLGAVFGLVCMWMASSNPEEPVAASVLWSIFISRALLGFMIGISALKLKWWLHGIVLGFISSIPMTAAIMDKWDIALGTLIMGIIYGFLIELITSIVFKSKPVAYTNE
ncbi:hypothetical protein ACFLSQ_04590 [Bacteroidota bacterium]